METNAPEGLFVFALVAVHRRRLRQVNGLERVNEEIRRRTGAAALFSNEDLLLRLVSATAAEIGDDPEMGRVCLAPSAIATPPPLDGATTNAKAESSGKGAREVWTLALAVAEETLIDLLELSRQDKKKAITP